MKTVFIPGNFNILHPGHLRLIKFARGLGSKIIIGLYSDKVAGKEAFVSEKLRVEVLKGLTWVDEVVIIKQSIKKSLLKLKPEIVLKGKEHEFSINEEQSTLDSYGGKLFFSSGDITFNSKDLINSSFFNGPKSLIKYPQTFTNKHKIKRSTLSSIVKKFKGVKVCIIGDLIIDKYINCEPLGMSQEDTSIAVRPINQNSFLGGAGIVASHASYLGADAHFISVVGNDENSQQAKNFLEEYKVKQYLLVDENRPTTSKTRYRADSKTLLRVNELYSGSIEKSIQEKILQKLNYIINDIDVLIFSDFNYGCMPQELFDEIMKLTQNKRIITAGDSQCSSQIGDVSRFKNLNLITPTEYEARVSMKNYDDGLTVLGNKLMKNTNAENIILKLGNQGLIIFSNKDNKVDKIEALNENPIDTAGAGDSLLIASALSLTVGASIYEASLIGNIASAIQVGRIGNIPLDLLSFNNVIEANETYSVI